MTVWAVSAVRNEADIVGDTFAHLLDGGVDRLLVQDGASTDGTTNILRRLAAAYPGRVDVVVEADPNNVFRQENVTNQLVHTAASAGADWILPVDADEYWQTVDGQPIGDALAALPVAVGVIRVAVHEYLDRGHRFVDSRTMPKVAFQPSPDTWLAMGAHAVTSTAGRAQVCGVLEVRTVPYRSREHFKTKTAAQLARLDPSLGAGAADHVRCHAGSSDAQLDGWWDWYTARPVVDDPIGVSAHA